MLHRRRWGLLWVSGLMLVLVVLLLGVPAVSAQETESSGWNVVLVLDQSTSMFRASDPCDIQLDANDVARPEGLPLRQWGAVKLIDYLGVESDNNDQIGIIYFGSEAQVQLGLFPAADLDLSRQAKELLKDNNCPIELNTTNTNSALEAAYSQLNNLEDGREKVVLLLTDGRPDLGPDWSIEDTDGRPGKRSYYMRHFELINQYQEAGIKLFIIALGENAQFEDPALAELDVLPPDAVQYRDLWNHAAEQTGGEYYKVETSDQLWITYHAVAAKLARVFPGGEIQGVKPDEGILNENFPVPEAATMIVTVERNPATQSTLLDPDGVPQTPSRDDESYQIYTFENPTPGRWTLRFEGAPTRYTVIIDFQIANLNLEAIDLPQVHPLGKPLPLRLRITDDAGEPLTDVLAGVTVIAEDGSEQFLSLAAVLDEPGHYEGVWATAALEGDYTLTFQATQGDKHAELQERVTLDPLVYLDLISPREGEFLQEAVVQFAVRRGTEAVVDDTGAFQFNISLTDSAGTVVATLDPSQLMLEDGVYTAEFGTVPQGDYVITLRLEALEEGITDELSAAFHLTPIPPTSTPEPPVVVPVIPPIKNPECLETNLGIVAAGTDGRVPLTIPMDTSALNQPAVVTVGLDAASGTPLTLNTTTLTLPGGNAQASAAVNLTAERTQLRPGRNALDGNILFSVQDGSPFCTVSFTVEVWQARMFLPESNLSGKTGQVVQATAEYDTSGQTTMETVQVALAGVPAEWFTIDEGAAILAPEADTQGTLRVPIRVAAGADPGLYKGQLVFTYTDGTQDTSDFSITVTQPSTLERVWPLLALLVVATVAGGGFYLADPLNRFCRLNGKLVYLSGPLSDIPLGGNRQLVTISGASQAVGAPSADAVLLIRARKKKPPVLDVKQVSGRLSVDGQPYQAGDKNIPLLPDAVIDVDGIEVKYESFMLGQNPDMDYDQSQSVSVGARPSSDLSSTSVPLAGYDISASIKPSDSAPVNPYDQPYSGRVDSDDDSSFSDLDYS